MTLNIRDQIRTATQGKPYVFVAMDYKKGFLLFELIRKALRERCDLVAIRADDLDGAGSDLLAKIRTAIEGAELVIAEISQPNPNVFYEVGYSYAAGKSTILMVEHGRIVPTNLAGQETIRYAAGMRKGADALVLELVSQVRSHLNQNLGLLRDMLEGTSPLPAYVVTTAKRSGEAGLLRSGPANSVFATRTYGDYLGIVGLLSAFGSMWGERQGVELVSGRNVPPNFVDLDLNMYLIGSDKTTPQTGPLLRELQKNASRRFRFGPDSVERRRAGDRENVLFDGRRPVRGRTSKRLRGPHGGKVWIEDYGLIVRCPHPRHPHRLVTILAGAHSLGTGGACIAATQSAKIQAIKEKLPPGTLAGKETRFWVLVRAEASDNGLLDSDGVSIHEAGVYD
jgi:hypothetical protein